MILEMYSSNLWTCLLRNRWTESRSRLEYRRLESLFPGVSLSSFRERGRRFSRNSFAKSLYRSSFFFLISLLFLDNKRRPTFMPTVSSIAWSSSLFSPPLTDSLLRFHVSIPWSSILSSAVLTKILFKISAILLQSPFRFGSSILEKSFFEELQRCSQEVCSRAGLALTRKPPPICGSLCILWPMNYS